MHIIMNNKEQIEQIVGRELKDICANCFHTNTCIYHKTAIKRIIQCELYELDNEIKIHEYVKGLCSTCDLSPDCKLAGRQSGIWACNEYK